MRRLLIALCLVATTAHAALEMVGGAQDKFLLIRLYATDGTAKTALSYTDMTITYTRNNASADADVTEATMTMGTHVDGGFVEVDATNSPGLYQFGIPDAAIADGAEEVTFSFNATGVVPVSKSVSLIDVDLRNGPNVAANTVTVEGGDATDALGVAQSGDAYNRIGANGAGLTAVPWNAAWDAEAQSEAADALSAYDGPTNAEMEARTLPAANYFDPSTDAVTAGTVSDKTGYALTSAYDAAKTAAQAGDAMDLVDNSVDAGAVATGAVTEFQSGLGTAADIRIELDSNSTKLASILADTNELQTDWANGGRLDLLIDTIVAQTDTLESVNAKIKAAVYDSITSNGVDTLTLSNGTTQEIDASGNRTTTEP
jgi:hypothetical protein